MKKVHLEWGKGQIGFVKPDQLGYPFPFLLHTNKIRTKLTEQAFIKKHI